MNLVLLGAPGAGKGTQAERLCEQLDLIHVATGELFRENLRNETGLGKLAKEYMDQGKLVPDDVTEAMVRDRLSQPDIEHGFVLDGFPRTPSQLEALNILLSELGQCIDAALYFKVSEAELISRLSGRRICSSCQASFHLQYNPFEICPYQRCEGEYLYQRDDDHPEVVRTRLETFYDETEPLVDYYKNLGILLEIDGMQQIEDVTKITVAALKAMPSRAA
ncbi:MAG: adenylate kinase [Anaerolineae bacterium]|nr:adenylate kinase [Anaerolineae bacterium]